VYSSDSVRSRRDVYMDHQQFMTALLNVIFCAVHCRHI